MWHVTSCKKEEKIEHAYICLPVQREIERETSKQWGQLSTEDQETGRSDAREPYFSGCILCSLDFWRPIVFVLKTEKVPDSLRANWSKLKFKLPSSKLKTVERRKEWVTFESLGQGSGEELWGNTDIISGQLSSVKQDRVPWLGDLAFSLGKKDTVEGEEWRSGYPVVVWASGVKVLPSRASLSRRQSSWEEGLYRGWGVWTGDKTGGACLNGD